MSRSGDGTSLTQSNLHSCVVREEGKEIVKHGYRRKQTSHKPLLFKFGTLQRSKYEMLTLAVFFFHVLSISLKD